MTIALAATLVAVTCFSLAMVYAGVMDVLTMEISNELILFLMFICIVFAPFAGIDLADVGWGIVTALLVFFLGVAFFAMGWIGGGDAKLATATSLWMGAGQTSQYLMYAALYGGILTLGLLVFRRLKLPKTWQAKTWVARLHSAKTGVPYGAAMGLAGLVTLKDSVWITGIN